MLTKASKTVNVKRRTGSRRKAAAVKGTKGEGLDMLKALRDFVGCVDGPADLSTNKKYLENFGR